MQIGSFTQAEQVDLVEAHARMKATASRAIAATVVGVAAAEGSDAAIIESDYAVLRRQPVHHARVIIVERRTKMVEQDHRHASLRTKVTISEPGFSRLDLARRCILPSGSMKACHIDHSKYWMLSSRGGNSLACRDKLIYFND